MVALRYYEREINRFEEIKRSEEGKGCSEYAERGAVLMCGATFSCGFSRSLRAVLLGRPLNKRPYSGQLLKAVVQVLANLNAFPYVNSGLVLSPEGSL